MLASPSTQVRASRTFSGGDVVGPYVPRHSQDEPTNRVAALTGLRALAVLLVVGTHAAFGTGKLTHGYVGLVYARLEIGVPIFFVLSGFLLFGPWVRAAAAGSAPPLVGRYAWRRVRRVMPAYLVTVLLVFVVYQFFSAGPNPGHTWMGLSVPHADADLHRRLPGDLSASGSVADVEPGGGGGLLCGTAAAGLSAAGEVVPRSLAARAAADGPGRAGGG